jgi:hypothetical protein
MAKYSELEAVRLRSKDNRFICSHCCPGEDFSKIISQKSFTLIEVDNRNRLKEVQTMKRKLRDQLYASDEHDGIYNLLAELKDIPLIRNRPSDNIKRGIGSSKVTDTETKQLIEENAKERGKAKKEVRGNIQTFLGQSVIDGDFKVELTSNISTTTTTVSNDLSSNLNNNIDDRLLKGKSTAVPTFLKGSRVMGGTSTSNSINTIEITSTDGDVFNELKSTVTTDVIDNVSVSNNVELIQYKYSNVNIEDVAWEDAVDNDDDTDRPPNSKKFRPDENNQKSDESTKTDVDVKNITTEDDVDWED